MAKSRGRKFAELVAPSNGVFAAASIPTIGLSKLAASTFSVNSESASLGGNVVLDSNDVTEHTNAKYFTNARAQATLSVAANSGHGALAYDNSNGQFTFAGITTEAIQDVVGAQLVTNGSHTGVSISYDDAGDGAIDLTVNDATKLPLAGGTMTGNLTLGDNVKAYFGASTDLQIYHDATNSHIINSTGELRFTGSNFAIKSDSAKLYLGASDDLKIYHDGNHSYMTNTGGSLYIRSTSSIQLETNGGVDMLTLGVGGAATLFHNGSAKLATTSTGVTVTGSISIGDWTNAINIGASNDLQLYHVGGNSHIKSDTGQLIIRTDALRVLNNANSEQILHGDANGAVTLYYDNSAKLATTSTGVQTTGTLNVNGAFTFPTSDGSANQILQTNGSGTLSWVTNTGGSSIWSQSGSNIYYSSGNVGIGSSSASSRLDIRTANTGSSSNFATQAIITRLPLVSGYNGVIASVLGIYDSTIHSADIGYTYNRNSTGGYDLAFSTNPTTSGSPVERMTINADGLVGIGTSSPNRDLSVAGVISAQTTANDASILLLPIASENRIYSRAGDASTTALPLTFRMGDTERMRITNGGNVGIGTLYPGRLLDVGGSGNGGIVGIKGGNHNQVNIAHSSNSGWGMLLTNSNGTATTSYHTSTSGQNNSVALVNVNDDAIHFGTDNTARMTIDHDGYVGIGTVDPISPLHISSTNDQKIILAGSADPYIRFQEGTTNKAYIQWNAAGYLQIGQSEDASSIKVDSGLIVLPAGDEAIVLQGVSNPYIRFQEGTTNKAYIQWNNAGYLTLANQEDASSLRIKDAIEFTTDGATYHSIWHAGNDGANSGLDADTLDGVQGSIYLKSNVANTIGNNLTSTAASTSGLLGAAYSTSYFGLKTSAQTLSSEYMIISAGTDTYISATSGSSVYIRHGANDSTNQLIVGSGATGLSWRGNTVWTAENDGAGSGLDADLLDGNQASAFATSAQGTLASNALARSGGTMTGTITSRDILLQSNYHLQRSNHHSGHLEGSYNNIGGNSTKTNPIYTIGSNYNPADATLSNMYGIGYSNDAASFISGLTGASGWGMYVAADGDARVWLDGTSGVISSQGHHYVGSNVVWNAGNDGSGSGLDSDTVDAQHASEMTWGHDVNHGTYSNFNSFTNTALFGAHFVQGTSNGPGHSGATQYYHQRMSLGANYNNYALQFAIPRNRTDSYLYYRNEEAGSASSWHKMKAGDSDTLAGLSAKGVGSATGASQVLTSNTNNYFVHQSWIDVGTGGIYSATNGAHLTPNTTTSYASWRSIGARGGYDGIMFDSGGDVAIMFDSSGNGGLYRQASARWYQYHHVAQNCTAFGSSTTATAYQIYCHGSLYATENIVAYSDRRIKENIVPIDNALEKVNKLAGVYYNRIDDEKKAREIGFIAQDVNEVAPELVTYAEDVDQYGVKYGNTTALLVEAVKELTQQVKDLKQELEELKNG